MTGEYQILEPIEIESWPRSVELLSWVNTLLFGGVALAVIWYFASLKLLLVGAFLALF